MRKPQLYIRALCVLQKVKTGIHFFVVDLNNISIVEFELT